MLVKHKFLLLLLMFVTLSPLRIYGEESVYTVYDSASGLNEEFSDYYDAYYYYLGHVEENDNLILKDQDRIIHMEYGIVEFVTDTACSITIQYESIPKDSIDYINGCYGIDGAYLSTSKDGSEVCFMVAGDKGYTDINNVILHPYETLDRVSMYQNKENEFLHNIKSQLSYDFYTYSLNLDEKLEDLEEGSYYSYDGHYFYDDFRTMIDDYRQEEYENAANSEPYYNYFEYLPYRSLSNYTYQEAEEYFYDELQLKKRLSHYLDNNSDNAADEVNRSELSGQIHNFFICQNVYGTNALLLLASAIDQSAYGKSNNAYRNNNLFQAAAYESDEERENERYASIESSIYAQARYFISTRFSNHLRSDYSGTFLGNKLSGINVNYTPDHYFGERTAAIAYELDRNMSSKDRNNYALAIVKDIRILYLHDDEELSDYRYSIRYINELSFVILDETEYAYKIALDEDDGEGLYDFSKAYAYIDKEDVAYVLNPDKIEDYDLESVHYDFNGGKYHGLDSLDVQLRQGEEFPIVPVLEGFEFDRFDEENLAHYKAITNLELKTPIRYEQELFQDLDLSDAILKVSFDDESSKEVLINTDMVFGYDINKEGVQPIRISYNGVSLETEVEFSRRLADQRETIRRAIASNDPTAVKRNLGSIDYPFTFSEIRNLDYQLQQFNQRNYVIDDKTEKYNLSISGLDLSLPDKKALSFIGDTYYVEVRNISVQDEEAIYEVGRGHGFEKVEGIDISFRFNFQNIYLNGPAIVQIDLQDKQNDLIYSVYHLKDNGDVIKCRTTQSDNFIQFLIEEEGPYLVMSMPTVNEYMISDNSEDLSYENMGYDKHRINFELMTIIVMTLIGIIGIITYYIIDNKRKNLWKDFRKSLHTAESVPEEKPKN